MNKERQEAITSDREQVDQELGDQEASVQKSELQWALESQNLAVRILNLLNSQIDSAHAIRQVLGMIRDFTGFEAVAIRLRDGEDFPYFETKGFPADFVRAENSLCVRTETGEIVRDFSGTPILECMCGNILLGRTNPEKSFFTQDGSFWSCCTTDLLATTTDKDRLARTRNRCNSQGYESVALIPLRSGNEIVGLLQLNDSRKNCFTENMIRFFEGIGASVGILIDRMAKEKLLREARDDLEIQVENRTRELKALNEKLLEEVVDRNTAEEFAKQSEKRYSSLFANMLEGLAHCQMVFDDGKPQDFIYLDVNEAFVRITGLKDVTGKRVSELIPGIKESNPELFEAYGRVAATGIPEKFETYVDLLGIWFSLSVYSPEQDHFVAVFENISERKRIQERLQENEAMLKAVLEQMPSGVTVRKAATGNLILFNERAREMLGDVAADKDELLKCSALYPDGRPCLGEEWPISRTIAHGENVNAEEIDWQRSDGTWITMSVSSAPVRDSEGKTIFAVAVFHDVTHRRKAEEAIRKSEALFRAFFEQAGVGVAQIDSLDGKFVRINHRYCDIVGYTPEEMKQLTFQKITYPDDLDTDLANMKLLLSGKIREFSMEKRYFHKNGSIIWVNLTVSPLWEVGEPPNFHIAVVEDITRRKKSEEVQDRLAAAVEQSADTVVITDPHGTIVYVNPSFERVSGYSPNEAIGNNPRILKSGQQDQEFYRLLWDTIGGGRIWTGHFVNKRKDGGLFEEDASISPVRDGLGNIVNFVAVKRDVSREVSLQRQLQQSQKMEAVGTLAGGIAHDFNNVLQIVLGFSELALLSQDLPDTHKDHLQRIQDAAKRGADLVHGLMAFSRRTEFNPKPLDINRQLNSMLKMLQRTIPKNIYIELVLEEKLYVINADPTGMDQILMNIAVNARDAMPEGGKLTFKTANVALGEIYEADHVDVKPGVYVLLTISDTGVGMDRVTQEHIFEPFFTTKEAGEGTGLGLAVVHGIVKQHGGYITCESEPGKGSTFKVYFPAMALESETNGLPVDETKLQGGTETILVADDEQEVRDLTLRILTKYGYKVLNASDGKEALQIYHSKQDTIDLVLLDLMMPVMGGLECLERLLRINASVKVVIVSGYWADGVMDRAMTSGAKGFIRKPFATMEVLKVIREVLDN